MIFLPQIYNPSLTVRKISDKTKLRDILQNTLQVLFNTVKIMKIKSSLRNCHGWEEPKETMMTNIMWYVEEAPGTEKDH